MPNNNPQQTTPQQTTPQQQVARASDSAMKAAERLSEGAEHASSVAIEKVRQVREDVQGGIEQQRAQVAERIRRLSDAMRASSDTLSTEDALAQQLFDSVGNRIEQVADYIATMTPSEFANDVTSLARRRPGLFFGGSFVLGLALGRFVKSSAGALENRGDGYGDRLASRPATRRALAASRANAPLPPPRAKSQVAVPATSPEASSTPRDVERGEGTKS